MSLVCGAGKMEAELFKDVDEGKLNSKISPSVFSGACCLISSYRTVALEKFNFKKVKRCPRRKNTRQAEKLAVEEVIRSGKEIYNR